MVFLIVFKPSLPRPLSFHWDHDIYEACPACVRAHELRTCDGKTKVTFEICQQHSDTCDARAESTALEDTVLKEIRTLVHPFYSPVPTFPVLTDTITAKSREDLRKMIKVTTATEHTVVSRRGVTARRHCAAPGNWRVMSAKGAGSREGELDLPRPKITYAHGGGCIYSPKPDVVLKPRAAVVAMDQYAKERLENIITLLDRGISCNLGPEFDINPRADMDSLFGEGSSQGSKSSSSCCSTAETASNPDLGIYSSVVSTSELSADEATPAGLARRAIDAAAEKETQAIMYAEKERLQECLATSALAKGLYFKRCNAQWVNAVGDVLAEHACGDGKGGIVPGGIRVQGVATVEAVNSGNAKEESKEIAAATMTVDYPGGTDATPSQDRGRDEGVETYSSPPTRTSTASMMTSTSTATSTSSISPESTDLSSHSSSSITTGGSENTPCNTVGSLEETQSIDPSKPGYGYALLHHDEAMQSPTIPGTSSSPSSPSSDSTSAFAGRACIPRATPSFGYLMLQSREQLVRSGQCTDEDLCMTSWGYSRLLKTHG